MMMVYSLLAHGVVLFHLAYLVFVALGGLMVLRDRRWAWLHLPAALWGAWVEFTGWVCPLTPLENRLRILAGLEAYSGDFVGRYVLPVLYPAGLTRNVQVALGVGVVALNLILYARAFRNPR
jgi:hypothetical protein